MIDLTASNEVLKYAVDNGIVDLEYVQQQIDMKRRNDVISCHKHKMWQGKNGCWYTYFPKQPKGRKLVKKNTEAEILDCIYEFYQEHNENSLKNVMKRWLDGKLARNEIEKQTYDRYKNDVRRFFVGAEIYKKDISLIKAYELEDFILDSISQLNLSNKAFSGMRTLIKGTFKYAHKRELTDISIKSFFEDLDLSSKIFAKPKPKKDVFNDIEVRKIESWIWEHDASITNMAILLGFYTGMRVGEIVALTHDDIDFENCTIDVHKTEIKYLGKDGKWVYTVRDNAKTEAGNRIVVFNSKAEKVLRRIFELNKDAEYLIIGDKGRVKEQNVTHKLYYICDALKIDPKCMHDTRKTYCTKMFNADVAESIITSQMGHTDIKTSRTYYYKNNFDDEQKKQQVKNAISY